MSDNKNEKSLVPKEFIASRILLIRGEKVMIDADIAELYEVTTKRLNQQVNRNIKRFPKRFMFELTKDEKNEVVANCNHLEKLKFSPTLPKVFTEHGIMMLANVLRNDGAITMSIKIIEIFIEMREVLNTHKDLLLKMQEIQQKVSSNEDQIMLIFEYIKQFEEIKHKELEQETRKKIGYKK